MTSPARFASITRRLEELPSDGGKAVDCLSGALLRTFIRLNELEAELKRLGRRVARCFKGQGIPSRSSIAGTGR